jgi:hypothetical protein
VGSGVGEGPVAGVGSIVGSGVFVCSGVGVGSAGCVLVGSGVGPVEGVGSEEGEGSGAIVSVGAGVGVTGCTTVTVSALKIPFTSLAVTLILTVPTLFAVMVPLELTDAISAFSDVYLKPSVVLSPGNIFEMAIFSVSPAIIVTVDLPRENPVIGISGDAPGSVGSYVWVLSILAGCETSYLESLAMMIFVPIGQL